MTVTRFDVLCATHGVVHQGYDRAESLRIAEDHRVGCVETAHITVPLGTTQLQLRLAPG